MPRHQPIVTLLLLTLALTLAAASAAVPAAAPATEDRAPATHTSPSGRYHLRSHDAAAQPGALMPAEPGAGEQDAEARQTLELTEAGRPPFIITAAEGRCTPHWSADEAFLALAIQTDRATFSLLILRLSDRKSITADFTALDQQRLQLFQKAGLDAAASALQLVQVQDIGNTKGSRHR